MPYFPTSIPQRSTQPLELIHVDGGVVAMGSQRLDQRWGNCKPRLVRVDSFSVAPTCVTVGLQKQVMGGVKDNAPDDFPGIFSFGDNEALVGQLTLLTGRRYGIGTEAEWEYAARDLIPDARVFMEAHPRLNLKTIRDLRDWLVTEESWLENPVIWNGQGPLTFGAQLVSDLVPDLRSPGALALLKNAPQIGLWTVFSGIGDLDPERHYFGWAGRGPVKHGQPNGKGVYDSTGGMWEWCADVYRKDVHTLSKENPFNAPEDPNYRRLRVLRGGDWGKVDRDCLRLACRVSGGSPDFHSLNFGARLFGPA